MTMTVTGPGGVKIDFPDGTDPQQIDSVMREHFSASAPKEYAGMSQDGHGLATKFGKGVADVVEGGMQLGLHGAAAVSDMFPNEDGSTGKLRDLSNRYDKSLNYEEKMWQAERQKAKDTGMELMRGVGSGVAVLPALMALPAAAPGLAGEVLTGIGQGVLGGSLTPVTGEGDYAKKKALQVGVGAATGGAVPLAIAGGKAVLKPAAEKVGQMAQAGLDYLPGNQTSASARKFAQAIRDDGDTIATLEARRAALGPQATYADVGGKNVQRLAGSLTRLPGQTPDLAEKMLTDRAAGQGSRLAESVKRNISDTDFHAAIDDISDAQRAASKPAYEAAFDAHSQLYNDRIAGFMKDPDFQQGLKNGLTVLRREALADGREFNPMELGITGFNEASDPVLGSVPSLRLLDAAKRGIDDMLEKYRDTTTGKLHLDEAGRALEGVRKSYVKELDSLTGGDTGLYAQARAAYAGPAKIKDAMWAGRRFARGDEEMVAKRFTALAPSEQEAYRDGVARQIIGDIRKKGTTPAALKSALADTDVQNRLRVVSKGPAEFKQLLDDIQREVTFSKTAHEAFGGSQTAQRLASERDLGMDMGGPLVDIAMGRPVAATGGLIAKVAQALKNPTLPKEARDELGKWLYSQKSLDQIQGLRAANSKAMIFGQGGNSGWSRIGSAVGSGAKKALPLAGPGLLFGLGK